MFSVVLEAMEGFRRNSVVKVSGPPRLIPIVKHCTNQSEIAFELNAAGQKRFAEVTRQHIGKRLAIIMDGQVCSAPVIRSEITGRKGQISGNFTQEQARELSNKINRALKK
jgi:preprotein translocase subunit SecD